MRTTGNETVPDTRQHAWKTKPGKPHSYWEERLCKVCQLEDMRVRDRSELGPRHDWSITTPCIEPVPENVSYQEFAKELKEHMVCKDPLLVGVPGKWYIGFSIGSGGYHLYPYIETDTVEHGFSTLLKWVRARQYNLYRYSDLDYLDKLNTPEYQDDD